MYDYLRSDLMAQVVSVAGQANEGRVIGDAGFKSSMWPFAGMR
jgi:hypothetical protein